MRSTHRGVARLTALSPLLALAAAMGGCPEPGAGASVAPPPAVQFDSQVAWKHLEAQVAFGPRPAGSAALEGARAYIEKQLSAAGLAPQRESFKAQTPNGEVEFANVYADLAAAGDDKQAPLVILASHFDTKRFSFPFIGANDAGSSTAVLLELARGLTASGPRSVSYRFLFVDGEEAVRDYWQDPDNRYGSKHHAEQLVARGEKARVKAVVLLDMVGDKDLRIQRDEYSTPWLYELFASAARQSGLAKHVDGKRERIADDHISFLEAGLPALDLIDFEYGPDNSYWHTHQDTLDKCSAESLGIAGRIVLAGLPALEKRVTGAK